MFTHKDNLLSIAYQRQKSCRNRQISLRCIFVSAMHFCISGVESLIFQRFDVLINEQTKSDTILYRIFLFYLLNKLQFLIKICQKLH